MLGALVGSGLAYCHLIDMKTPQAVDHRALLSLHWTGGLILNESIDLPKAARLIAEGAADAIAFGRAFVANPDLVERFRHGHPLAELLPDKLYAPGAEGYTDYPPYRS